MLTFISIFGSLLWGFLLGFGVTFVGLVPSSFLGAWVSSYCCYLHIVVMYVCAVTCGRGFTVLSVLGVLISWSVLVFSPTLISLSLSLPYYNYCLYCCYFYWLLLLCTELLALCDERLGWSSWLGRKIFE